MSMITAKGFDQLGARLEKVANNLQGTFRSEVLEPTLLPAGSLAEALAPVRTGNLRSHTGARINSETEGELYSETDYSAAVNFGTSKNTRGVGFFSDAQAQLERDFPPACKKWLANAIK